MNRLISQFLGWFGYGGALGQKSGTQVAGASGSLVDGTVPLAPDGALQLSTVWSCVSLLANMIASLDGATHVDGVSGGLGGPPDRQPQQPHDLDGILGSHAAQSSAQEQRLRPH